MNEQNEYTYPVSYAAESFSTKMYGEQSGKRYGQEIDRSIAEHVAKGHYSHEYAMTITLSQLYAGNDGD